MALTFPSPDFDVANAFEQHLRRMRAELERERGLGRAANGSCPRCGGRAMILFSTVECHRLDCPLFTPPDA